MDMIDDSNTNRILLLLESMKPMKDHIPKVGSLGSWDPKSPKNFNSTYSKFINEWIPNQPDSGKLMELFILCRFNLRLFFILLSKKESCLKYLELK